MTGKKKCRVLIVGPNFTNAHGGIASVLWAYSQAFIWTKYDMIVLDAFSENGNWRQVIAFVRALLLFPIRSYKRQIVHVHIGGHSSFLRKSVFVIMAKLLRKKTILHFHNQRYIKFMTNGPRIVASYLKWIVCGADTVVVLSQSMAEQLLVIFPTVNIKTIHNPCWVEYHGFTQYKTKDPIILFAGDICKNKGCFDLIEAFAIIHEQMPNAVLVMAGRGNIEKMRIAARNFGILDCVRFPGWIMGKDLEQQFLNASIFCLPSYNEGVPMVILEALAYGIPVVTTPVGGIPELISSDVSGILTPVGDVSSLAENLFRLLYSFQLRKELGYAGRQFVLKNYSLQSAANKLEKIYSELSLLQKHPSVL